ncbi:Yos1p [Saccharomyces paradoxus]|uniref:Yos1p n=1 Tax=Saccharomyces paradoxus TaxID=27291 RepID=A0A8B8UQ60_SACPA|nr:Rps24a [Saccharomyces paradoxus]QHS72861.1 Rps24a [Saccharomyces paradoxus]
MVLFGLGRLFYVILLLINAVAVLSEERFLRRIGLGRSNDEAPVFGQDQNTTKSKVVQLIGAVQTLLRSMLI